MIKITKLFVGLILCLIVTKVNAQEDKKQTHKEILSKMNSSEKLDLLLNSVENDEKAYLKNDLLSIEKKLNEGLISKAEAEIAKKASAEKRALNIKNRQAVMLNKYEFYKRQGKIIEDTEFKMIYQLVEAKSILNVRNGDDSVLLKIGESQLSIGTEKDKPKHDIRTSNDLLLAFGFNNVITENQSFSQTPFENLGSSFIELGWYWKTRLFKNSNWARVKYGFAFQWNKLNLKDDLYFVQDANKTRMEKFPTSLRKSQLRNTNLVVPLYFEFGPSAKVEKKDRIRFNTWGKFKIGLGGYAGVRLDTQQKLKYKEDGQSVKQKINKSYNASDFVYGLGAYIGINDIAIYAKYDLSPVFRVQAIDMNNISLGVRFDID